MTFLFMSVMSLTVVSCGDDDEGSSSASGNLDTPKYESASALYSITEASSEYESIEFTASGNYIITTRGSYAQSRAMESEVQKLKGFLNISYFKTAKLRSSGSYGNIIYGTYTKNGDTYVLDGFGTITVVGGGSNAISLDITTTGGSKVTVGAQLESQYSASEKTNMLCRTWKFDKISVLVKSEGQTLLDKSFNSYREFAIAMMQLEGEDYDEQAIQELLAEEPTQVIFTKSGTYVVFYANGELAVSTWKWQDEKNGKARYSWDYKYIDDPEMSGVINIAFEGSQLVIKEYLNREGYDDYDDGMEGYVEYRMSEVK